MICGGAYAITLAAALVVGSQSARGATVAYWRFEEGPLDGPVSHDGIADGVHYPGALDSSGNGNHLSVWAEGWAGFAYRSDLASPVIPQTGAANAFSVQNSGSYPAMFTDSAAMRTMTPSAFTIEVGFKPETGGYRTLVGRDSRGTATINGDLAALYLQIVPGDAVAIKYCDVTGVWHEAISAGGAVTGFPYPDTAAGHWYNMAAVSDGSLLSLYLMDVGAGTGYQLVASTDMTGSSTDTALTAGLGSGGDWAAGNWSVGRGLYAGGHGDRAYGLIDEVRISDTALTPGQFLYSVVPEPSVYALGALGGLALMLRRRQRAR